MGNWNHFGGDERYPLGQAYDQIHAIKLKDVIRFRRAYSAFGYEVNVGKLQPLASDLDEVLKSLIKDNEDKSLANDRDNVASFWKDRIQSNIDEKLDGFYFDLDGYASTVEKITQPKVAKTVFTLSDPEIKALKEVVDYFAGEHQTLLDGQTRGLFNRAVYRLARDYDGSGSRHHPELNSNDVFCLTGASIYIHNLNVAIDLTTPKKEAIRCSGGAN